MNPSTEYVYTRSSYYSKIPVSLSHYAKSELCVYTVVIMHGYRNIIIAETCQSYKSLYYYALQFSSGFLYIYSYTQEY